MESRAPTTVVGVFANTRDADAAINELYQAGFRDDELGLVAPRADADVTPAGRTTETTAEGAVGGAVTGGAIGAVLGAAAALLIPGVGPALAGGILAAALGGGAIGAAAGGLLGALTDIGVPEEDARYYETEFRSGRTLVTVRAAGRTDEALQILRRHGAYDATTRSGRSVI